MHLRSVAYDFARVAPHTGAWIEIQLLKHVCFWRSVAPHTGTWIEMRKIRRLCGRFKSHPAWVRELKLHLRRTD